MIARTSSSILSFLVLVVCFQTAAAKPTQKTAVFYVAPGGDDATAGTQREKPLRTLQAALEKSRAVRQTGARSVEIRLRGGIYPMWKPLWITAEDSGLVIAAVGHERPILSSGVPLREWTRSKTDPNIWLTEISAVREGRWNFHELFVNGRRKTRTRLPAAGYFHYAGSVIAGAPDAMRFSRGDLDPSWAKLGNVEVVAYSAWAQTRNQIRSLTAGSDLVTLAGEALANQSEQNGRFFVENAPIDLQPGQWHLDPTTGVLSFWPDAGEDVLRDNITAPALFDLLQVRGDDEKPVHDVTFRGLAFAETDWRLPDGSDDDTQASVERGAAVQLRFAQNCTFERCVFEHLGEYALELRSGCTDDNIIGNEMRDLGAGGIRIGEEKLAEANEFPCGHNLITDNHIYGIGRVNAPGVGIFVLLSSENQIAHNEVDHTFYTAISIGWSWGYGETQCSSNIVEYNYLHDIGQGKLSDMGGVYTLGLQPGAIIRNNLIGDVNVSVYGGWGLYTDEGSTGIVLESNIVYRCQSAGFHQHYGQDNIIRNNIFAFNKEHQLMRTRIEPHRAFVFTNNIVYFDHGSLFGGNWGDDLEMDENFYFDTRHDGKSLGALRGWQERGHDMDSIFADPLFAAPGEGNFHLKPESPALRWGFHQIDLRGAGVRPSFRQRAAGQENP